MRGLLLAALVSSAVQVGAHPVAESKHSLSRRTVDLDAFRLVSTTEYVNATEVEEKPGLRFSKRASYVDTATEFVKRTVPGATFRVINDHYVGDNGIAHVYLRQTAHDLDIDNADFNVNIGKDGQVFSYGNSFFTGPIPELKPLAKRDRKDPVKALRGAARRLQLPVNAEAASATPSGERETYTIQGTTGTVTEPEARLVYFQTPDGKLVLTWRVETDIYTNWLLSYVDADAPEKVLGVVDYTADAQYQVYEWGVNDPTEGARKVIKDPEDMTASEFSWQGSGPNRYTTTRGNNGIAQVNPSGGSSYMNNTRPDSEGLHFSYQYKDKGTNYTEYADASVTQLFYSANHFHDLMYELGFTEKAGNFENDNNGQGGIGGDAVILNAQDGSGLNNANFATPPDGQPGRMRMYIWDRSDPVRDCSFEAGVVIHEYAHGVSNRLTGGPANTRCLSALESGGMGEGWGDFLATAIRLKKHDKRTTDYAMGAWVSNNPAGIRKYVYSTDMTTNPHVYSDVDGINRVHGIGTVWATMLYEVLWNLIDKHGKNDDARPVFRNGVPTDGKYLAMKLVLDGMALQPCLPNFVQARDAIIDADKTLTGGANACELWRAFAKRGLGANAQYNPTKRTQSFEVPSGVC